MRRCGSNGEVSTAISIKGRNHLARNASRRGSRHEKHGSRLRLRVGKNECSRRAEILNESSRSRVGLDAAPHENDFPSALRQSGLTPKF